MGTRTKAPARALVPAAKSSKKNDKGAAVASTKLSNEKLRQIHSLMVEARVLEERLIRMNKAGEGYFWIGGPGEELSLIHI
mgnify:CR=1 FL=1